METYRRVRAWRRIRFTRAGVFVTVGALAVGAAAITTGNNLLYLLLGALLGAMAVSGWLSEHTLRSLEIARSVPAGVPVDREFRIRYRVKNRKRRLASFAVELQEPGLPGVALIPRVRPGHEVEAASRHTFVQRGVHPLEALTLATEFPFGLFRKERDVPLPGEVVIWPRTDRPVPERVLGAGDDAAELPTAALAGAAARGEFRSLREYRFGDDARDIHWRTSARLRRPVVREYDRDAGQALWVVLDTACPPGPDAEAAVELAASLCARAHATRRPFALSTGSCQVEPGAGEVHLERTLDALARVDFPGSGSPGGEVPLDRAVLVTTGAPRPGYADILRAVAVGEDREDGSGPGGEE